MKALRTIPLLLLASVLCLAAPGNPPAPKNPPVPPPPPAAPAPKISVASTLAEESVLVNEAIHFSGTVANDGDASARDLQIAVVPSGYTLHLGTPPGGPNGSCETPAASNKIADELPRGGRIAFCGTLLPAEQHLKRKINFIIHYSANGQSFDAASSPGAFTVQTRTDYNLTKLYGWIKDLAFPIMLALFGVFLKLITDNRELRAETWKQMLPKSHDLAGKYYMPIAGSAVGISQSWTRYSKAGATPADKTQEVRLMFFYIMLFHRLMRDMRYEIGGFYFKDRIGEQIANFCWTVLRDGYFPATLEETKRNYAQAVRLKKRKEELDEFLDQLDSAGPGSPLFKTFAFFSAIVARPNDYKSMIDHFDLLRAILIYESNRVYHYWYRLPETLDLTAAQCRLVDALFSTQANKDKARKYIELSRKG